jgi:hypothetical protein
MRARTREYDQRSLPKRLRTVSSRQVLVRYGFEWVHAGDLHVPAERQSFDSVLDLASAEGPDLGAEADEVLLDLEPELARDQVVAGLMDQDYR